MIAFLLENWQLILTTLSIPIAWIFGGKQKANINLKKENAEATVTIQGMYQTFALQYESQYKAVLLQVDILQKHVSDLDLRNAITLEASESWERKFNELQKESNSRGEEIIELRKESDSRGEKLCILQKEHDSLKKAFDSLKKSMK